MESSTTGGDPFRRYEAIEDAYREGRWATVLEAGTVLLRELPENGDPQEIKGLHHRLHLLMAHTLFHGYGDRDAAEDLYTLVHQSDAESALRQMAEDGLDQCHRPLSSTFVAEEEEEDMENGDLPRLFLPESDNGAADALAKPADRPKPDPVIAIHALAAPLSEPNPAVEPEPPAGAPVMRGVRRRDAGESDDPGLAMDPFRPCTDAPLPETLIVGLPVMPWLRSTEAGAEAEPAPREPLVFQEAEEEEERLSPPSAEVALAPPPTNGHSLHAGSLTLQPLIPEVVEEPELIEIHQATPSLAEEVDLVTSLGKRPSAAAPEGGQPPEATPEDDLEDLRSSLLLVRLG